MSDHKYFTIGPEEDDNALFGRFLHLYRSETNYTRTQAAHIIGVTSEYIRLIEQGKRIPSLGMATKIFDAYKVSYTSGANFIKFDNSTIVFTSRIKNARGKRTRSDIPRAVMIGDIVTHLISVDVKTLREIYSTLIGRESDG